MTELGVQKHDDGVKAANHSVVDDALHFIPGYGFAEAAVDTARGLYSGITGDNDAAAKHMYDAAMDIGPSFGGLNPLATAGQLAYDINAADKRKDGAMPDQAPTLSESVWNWMTSDPAPDPSKSWDVHNQPAAPAAPAPSAAPAPDSGASGANDHFAE